MSRWEVRPLPLKLSKTLQPFKPTDPKMPTFARFLAERVSSKYRALNNVILVEGPRGTGKSWFCLSLAYGMSVELSRILHKPPEEFFTPANITSVDDTGILNLLSSPAIKKMNNIFILDDSGVALNARKHAHTSSIASNEVIQIARIFRGTIIFNLIKSKHLDVLPREIADYTVEVMGANVLTGQSLCRISMTRPGRAGSKDLHPYLRWNKKRIRYWLGSPPPENLASTYEKIRFDQTSQHIDKIREKHLEDMRKAGMKRKPKDTAADLAPELQKLHGEGTSVRQLAQDFHVSKYTVEKALGIRA